MDTSSYYTLGTLGTPGSSLSLSLLHTYAWMYGTLTQVETRSECVCLGALMACSINHEMMKAISFI